MFHFSILFSSTNVVLGCYLINYDHFLRGEDYFLKENVELFRVRQNWLIFNNILPHSKWKTWYNVYTYSGIHMYADILVCVVRICTPTWQGMYGMDLYQTIIMRRYNICIPRGVCASPVCARYAMSSERTFYTC